MVCEFVDTYPAFRTYWAKVQGRSLDHQIEAWATEYLSAWPELLAKQIEEYSSQNLDWREIAREKVFPHLRERLAAMEQAHHNLLELCETLYSKVQPLFSLDSKVLFVIYVGIGCGAGCATQFHGSPAILFGLENIAECGWSSRETVSGLVAHELGHLVHHYRREQYGKPMGCGPWWQLYEEGFAQFCESLILGSDTLHQARGGSDDDWLEWCRSHKGWLAGEFVRTVDTGRPVLPFFGSWFEVRGKSETGQFLGYEAIKELGKQLNWNEIALLDTAEVYLRPILEQMTERDG